MFNQHKTERNLKQENDEDMTALGYFGWLINSCLPTMEMRYYFDDALVGVGLIDLGAKAASSVYFYFNPAPEISRLSPGVFSTLHEIEFCQKTGRDWLYLGLYVEDCPALNYKGNYFPHEHPWGASSWKEECVAEVEKLPRTKRVVGHVCAFGMVREDLDGPGPL